MSADFWAKPTLRSVDDYVAPQAMLNLKTANLVDYGWTNPPAPDPSMPDTVGDLGKITLQLAPSIAGAYTLSQSGPPLVFSVPLRSVGGDFSIGADTYQRPPPMTNKYLFLYVTTLLSAVWSPHLKTWIDDQNFGWLYQGPLSSGYPTTGYLNCTVTVLDGAGATVQTKSWCDMQSKGLTQGGGSTAYDDNPLGAFATGQGSGPLGSYILYPYVRVVLPITLPTTDFDNGRLVVTIAPSDTSSTGDAGAPLAATFTGAAPIVVLKLIASSSISANSVADWDF